MPSLFLPTTMAFLPARIPIPSRKNIDLKEQVPTEESSVKSLFIRRNSMAVAGQWETDGAEADVRLSASDPASFQLIFGTEKGAMLTLV